MSSPLLSLMSRLEPGWRVPACLGWARLLERAAAGEAVRGLCSEPIRGGKSETTNIGIVLSLKTDPSRRLIHFTHSFERAQAVGKRIRDLARLADVGPTKGYDTITQWRNDKGGGVTIMSADQSRLGEDCHGLYADDPIDEYGAQDNKVRDAVDAAIVHYTARCVRNGQPGPILLVMSRWDLDDPIGRRLKRKAAEWEYVHTAAVTPDGQSYAPDWWPIETLMKTRRELAEHDPSERLWYAQFMNDPKAAMDARFGAPHRYDEAPNWPGFRFAMGIDLAYTPGEGDFFACVSVKIYGSVVYVVDVVRERADFNVLENLIRNRWERFGRCPIYSYIAGPEKGAIRYFTDRGIPIQGLMARYNKATRAQKTVDRWNAGRVLVPMHSTWGDGFIDRVRRFTGSDKASDDDEIDAMVSVVDGACGTDASSMPRAFGRPRI